MSDSLKVQNVSQILASLALSAALQQHFSRGPAGPGYAVKVQRRPPRATGGWSRPLPQAGAPREAGAPPAPAPGRSRGPELVAPLASPERSSAT